MRQEELAKRVAEIPLFEKLDERSRRSIARLMRLRQCKARERIVWEGDPAGSLFLAISGYFKAVATNRSGKELLFSIMGPGEVFGELSVLDGEPRSATVIALQPGTLGVIEQAPLFELLRASPDLTIQIAKGLCKRVRVLSKRCESLSSMPVPGRLANVLVTLAGRHGQKNGGALRIPVRLSQQDLGSMAGATRESVNKQLRAWSDTGVVRLEKGCLVIVDLNALRTVVATEGRA